MSNKDILRAKNRFSSILNDYKNGTIDELQAIKILIAYSSVLYDLSITYPRPKKKLKS